jgi:hypothetical protein
MRSITDIKTIKSKIQYPYSVENFLSLEDIEHLIKLYDVVSEDCLIKKNTGPVTLDLTPFFEDQIIKNILDNLKKEIGNFEITAAFFFKTHYPHIIHNDDTFELPQGVYKGITIPLKAYGRFTELPKLCFFDQFYFHGPAKFFKGSSEIPTHYNKQVYNYDQVDELSTIPFSLELYKKYFTHLKKEWLEGLSFHSALDWSPGSALIFDSVRLHCASDFRSLGIDEKLGISIFTKVN